MIRKQISECIGIFFNPKRLPGISGYNLGSEFNPNESELFGTISKSVCELFQTNPKKCFESHSMRIS